MDNYTWADPALAQYLEDKALVYKVNILEHPDREQLKSVYGLRVFVTTVFMDPEGRVIHRYEGVLESSEVKSIVEENQTALAYRSNFPTFTETNSTHVGKPLTAQQSHAHSSANSLGINSVPNIDNKPTGNKPPAYFVPGRSRPGDNTTGHAYSGDYAQKQTHQPEKEKVQQPIIRNIDRTNDPNSGNTAPTLFDRPKPTETTTVKPPVLPPPVKPVPPLPNKPKPTDFVVNPIESAPYAIQLGAFSVQNGAFHTKEQLEAQYPNSTFKIMSHRDGRLRVVITGFASQAEARMLMNELGMQGFVTDLRGF
jgi:SPOR domain